MLTKRGLCLGGLAALALPRVLYAEQMPISDWPKGYVPPAPAEQEAIKQWFANANVIGSCCGLADGYMRGFTYKVWEGESQVEKVMFKDCALAKDCYELEVYDLQSHEYVSVRAGPETFVPKNPTGYYVVWIMREDVAVKVRCFAPIAQG